MVAGGRPPLPMLLAGAGVATEGLTPMLPPGFATGCEGFTTGTAAGVDGLEIGAAGWGVGRDTGAAGCGVGRGAGAAGLGAGAAGRGAGAAALAAGWFSSFFLSSAFAWALQHASPARMRAKEPYFMALDKRSTFIVSSFFFLFVLPIRTQSRGLNADAKQPVLLSGSVVSKSYWRKISPAPTLEVGVRDAAA